MTGVRRSLMPKAAAALVLLLASGCTQESHAATLRIVGRRGIRSIEEPSETLGDRDAYKHIAGLESSFTRQLRQDGGGSGPTSKTRAHGYTAGISIGVLMPATAIIARNFREFAPAWFYLHAPLGIVALVAGIVGVILGSQLPDDISNMTAYDAHKALGVLAVVAAGLQITALVLRPKPDHPKRYIFNHVHHNVGRLALACGIAATYLGLKATGEATKFYVGYSIVLAVLAAVWLGKETLDFVRIATYNRRVRKAGFEAPSLPGGHPMNGGFAATFMQRRPPLHSDGSDAEAALPHDNVAGASGMRSLGAKPGYYDNSNPGSKAELLKGGNGFAGSSTANSSATSLHQAVNGSSGNRGAVEMQRRQS